MKKVIYAKFVFLIFCFILLLMGCFSKEVNNYDHKKNIKKSVYAEIPLKRVTISIINSDTNRDNKFLSVYDNKNNSCLFKKELYLPNTNPLYSFYKGEEVIGFQLKFRDSPYSRYILLFDDFPYFKEIELSDKWIASSIICRQYILYSTDFCENTIKRINLDTGEIFEYEGWYPNVEIYESLDENILGVFNYQNQFYNIFKDKIITSNETFDCLKKDIFDDYLK